MMRETSRVSYDERGRQRLPPESFSGPVIGFSSGVKNIAKKKRRCFQHEWLRFVDARHPLHFRGSVRVAVVSVNHSSDAGCDMTSEELQNKERLQNETGKDVALTFGYFMKCCRSSFKHCLTPYCKDSCNKLELTFPAPSLYPPLILAQIVRTVQKGRKTTCGKHDQFVEMMCTSTCYVSFESVLGCAAQIHDVVECHGRSFMQVDPTPWKGLLPKVRDPLHVREFFRNKVFANHGSRWRRNPAPGALQTGMSTTVPTYPADLPAKAPEESHLVVSQRHHIMPRFHMVRCQNRWRFGPRDLVSIICCELLLQR